MQPATHYTNDTYITNNNYNNRLIIRTSNVCGRKYRKTLNQNRKKIILFMVELSLIGVLFIMVINTQ